MIGLKFEVEPADYVERVYAGLEPLELARRISREKAEVVAAKHKDALIIAADTFIVLDGQVLGKPHTEKEARDMLETINGRAHRVITGFSIIDTDTGKTVSRAVETRVYIKKLSRREINAYVQSGEPGDKAGAYAIQGLGSVIVERIEGDYFNVIGLPLCALTKSLKEFGIEVLGGLTGSG